MERQILIENGYLEGREGEKYNLDTVKIKVVTLLGGGSGKKRGKKKIITKGALWMTHKTKVFLNLSVW
jgi:hypothetical protein